jgi:hypothetical protein
MNRFLAASVIGLFLLAILAAGVYFYQRYSIILLDPMRGVPADAAIIIEIRNPGESLNDFFSGPFRKSINDDTWIAAAEKNFHMFDSLLQESSSISEIWEDQSIVISTHLVKAGRFDFLYLANLPRGWTEQNLKRFIEEGWSMTGKIERREYESVNIYESRLNDSTIFTFASTKSVALFSVSPTLVEQAVRQLKDGRSVTQTNAFLNVVPPAGENGSIHIYFNNQALKDIATSISPDYNNGFFRMAASFARWNGYKAKTENEYFLMEGKTITFDTTSYLSYFRNQQPQVLNAAAIAPLRTALLFSFGLSSFAGYSNHLHANDGYSLNESARKKVLNDLQQKFQVSFEPSFTSWIGNEMDLIITEPAGISFDNNVYACIRARSIADAMHILNNTRDAVAKQSGSEVMTENYKDHEISTIALRGIIPLVYGKSFSGLNGCSYTSINDYVVFSNQHASLKSLIDEIEDGKTLLKDDLYRNASAMMNATANVMLYVNTQRSFNLYHPDKMQSFLSTLYSSSGIHAQWNYKSEELQSKLLFDFHKKAMKEPVLYWATQLDTILDSDPVIVNEKDGNTYIYLQDARHNLYKLDESGTIVWKKNIEEKILSSMHVVDLYHDGRQQLLFNTSTKLTLLDGDGNPAGNYPIRLPAPATNGCTLSATASSFIIYVACSNHYLYAYEAGGKPVSDWVYLKTENFVTKPIQSFAGPKGTVLLISADSGEVIISDRKGSEKISFGGKFIQSKNGKSYLYESDSTGNMTWMTTDTLGNIILFTLQGSYSKTKTGDFTSSHEFQFINTAVPPVEELFYFDKENLYSLDEDGKILFSKSFPGFSTMQAVRLPAGRTALLVNSITTDRLNMVDEKGDIEKGFPLKGSVHPVVAELHRSVILCGNNHGILYCYKID